MESVLSSDGRLQFPRHQPGEHVVRAYFMNDGHTVAYRKILIEEDTTLDWYEGHNWITVAAFNNTGHPLAQDGPFSVALPKRMKTNISKTEEQSLDRT